MTPPDEKFVDYPAMEDLPEYVQNCNPVRPNGVPLGKVPLPEEWR